MVNTIEYTKKKHSKHETKTNMLQVVIQIFPLNFKGY